MADFLNLGPDEAVILKTENIGYGTLSALKDELILTNKAVIYVKRGLLGNAKNITRFPLNEIKVYNDQAQAMCSRAQNGYPRLEIYFTDSKQNFLFYKKSDVIKWVDKINELVTGKKTTTSETNARMALPGSEFIAKTLKGTLDVYKDTFGFTKKIQQRSCKCPGCGSSLTGSKGETTQCPYCGTYVSFS